MVPGERVRRNDMVRALVENRRDWIAPGMGGFITFAGVMHFASPKFFDDIVPPWLPLGERFWTYVSGVAELVVGPMLVVERTRSWGADAAMGRFVVVYPANLYMAWDWRDRPMSEQLVTYTRLPFQFLFIWLAWRVAKQSTPTVDRSVGQ